MVIAYDANTQLSPSCRCAEEPGCWAGPSALCGRIIRKIGIENEEEEISEVNGFVGTGVFLALRDGEGS